MARKFITAKEHAFIARVNKELIQKVIGQEVIYYALSREETTPHDVYGEAVDKVWYAPVTLNCLVSFDNPDVKTLDIGLDAEYNLEVYVLTDELIDRNIKPNEGDFVEFGQKFFEISSVTLPQLAFGQVNNKLMTKFSCVSSRESVFAGGSYSSHEVVDNTHPVQTPISKNVRD